MLGSTRPFLPTIGVAGDADHALVDLQIRVVRGGDDLSADRAACAEHDDLAWVRVAEPIGEPLHQHLAVAATALASVGGAFSDYSGEIGLRAGGSVLRTTLVAISHPSAASANGTTSGQLESFANTTSTSTMPSARPSNAPTTAANRRIPPRYAA